MRQKETFNAVRVANKKTLAHNYSNVCYYSITHKIGRNVVLFDLMPIARLLERFKKSWSLMYNIGIPPVHTIS